MAVSKSESARFGFDKTSPTPSPRSSPPTTNYQTPKSRLPIRNRQGTPQSEGSTSTATRVALTTIINRRTPSPHPSPDDGPQIKIIYGRNEGTLSPFNVPSSTTTDSTAQQDKENMLGGKMKANSKSELGQVNGSDLKMTNEDPVSATKALLAEPAITITPGTPSRHSQVDQIQENKPTTEIVDGTANTTRNFSHPGRRARTSLGGSSTHSINTVSDRESATHLPPSVSVPEHTLPPRSTSRHALTEDALTLVHENDREGASSVLGGHNLYASSAQVEQKTKEDEDNGFRTVRLSLRSDTPFGPTLRISKEADQFLMGQPSKTSGRLRMPSFGTTSSDESAEKEVKASVAVGEQARARRVPPSEDEYCLTKSIPYHEQPDCGSSSTNSATQIFESAGTRDTSASSANNKFASVEGNTLIGARIRPIRDRNPSPHAALLFSRALASGAPASKNNVLTTSKTSPNLLQSSSSPGSSPPMPPPKDILLADIETTAEVVGHENITQPKQHLPPQKQQLGLRTRNLRSTAIPSPVRATPDSERSWVMNLDSPESRGQTPTQYSRLHSGQAGGARTSMDSGSFNSKKLPRTTSKPALVMSNLRSLFHRRSNNEPAVPDLPKPALPSRSPKRQTVSPLRFTPTSSPTSSTTAWTPSSTLNLTSPTRTSNSRAKGPTASTSRYAVLSSMRPPTRGKVQQHNQAGTTAPVASQVIDNENLTRATSLALHLTSLAAQPANDSATLIPLARTLITTITATRDAEAAMVAAGQKAEEARVCWEGCQAGVRECMRLIEGAGVGGVGRK